MKYLDRQTRRGQAAEFPERVELVLSGLGGGGQLILRCSSIPLSDVPSLSREAKTSGSPGARLCAAWLLCSSAGPPFRSRRIRAGEQGLRPVAWARTR